MRKITGDQFLAMIDENPSIFKNWKEPLEITEFVDCSHSPITHQIRCTKNNACQIEWIAFIQTTLNSSVLPLENYRKSCKLRFTNYQMDINLIIQSAKLGRSRKDAQIDTCSVFAAALYDVLSSHNIPCQMVTASNPAERWYHSLVEVSGQYFDSIGEFSTDIYRKRAKVHPTVKLNITYKKDFREECYEPEFKELYNFYAKELKKSIQKYHSPSKEMQLAETL
jgi:hypothetical protein